ncbi:hypothetical protein BGZ91_000303 [Linnemannia elongata]|nr:hypothetical protein BGZ91_000303 [Linnemannia elongata]KAG0080553.1 hypothetical protein BGZ90_011956 [Linnemannia elongata]
MPLLIQAVPLAKNWLGGRYWRTPAFDTLPEELEYLPREEIAKRFEKLNRIALRTYPTVWPTIIFLLVFLGLASIAGYALSKIGSSNLAIMGQGICFLLPIVIVVWVKVRKESKARARLQASESEGAEDMDGSGHYNTRDAVEDSITSKVSGKSLASTNSSHSQAEVL